MLCLHERERERERGRSKRDEFTLIIHARGPDNKHSFAFHCVYIYVCVYVCGWVCVCLYVNKEIRSNLNILHLFSLNSNRSMHASSELGEINVQTNTYTTYTYVNSNTQTHRETNTHTVLVRGRLAVLINIIDPCWSCDAEGRHCEVIRVIAAKRVTGN